MKKNYQKPTIDVVALQHQCNLLDASPEVKNVESPGTGMRLGGPGSGPARSRGGNMDDWEE